jgi:PAS domain S-box-containing protein
MTVAGRYGARALAVLGAASGAATGLAPTLAITAGLALALVLAADGHAKPARLLAALAGLGALLLGASVQATLAWLLLAGAVVTLEAHHRGGFRPAEALAFLAATLALFALVVTFYGGTPPESMTPLSTPGALAVLALGGAVLAARWRDGVLGHLVGRGPGGALARTFLPVATVVPLFIGWLRLAGGRAQTLDVATGVSLLVSGSIAAVCALVAWNALHADRSSAALGEAHRMLDAIVESIPDVVFVKEAEHLTYVRANRAFEELLALPRGQFLGKTGSQLFSPANAAASEEQDRHVLAGDPVDLEEPRDTPRGERWFHTRKVAILGEAGHASHLLGIAEDITRRRSAERDRQRWASVFAHARWGVVVATPGKSTPDLMNSAWAELHGYTPAELGALPLETVFTPEARARVLEHLAAGESRTFESRHRKKDGSLVPVLVSLTALEDGDLAVHAQDVTELKQSEEELRRAKEAAESTSRELESFSYSVSHDLRAPLRAIDGFSQALLEDWGSRLDATGRDHLARVRNAAQRMALLIDDLLTLSKVSRAELARQRVDLAALATEVDADLRHAQPGRTVRFVAPGELAAHGDARLLRVVLANLLENAWKFTARRPEATIEVGRADGAYFVRDDGVGFDMAHAKKLFGAFQRLHGMSEFPGTGIGLATVQRIIHRHGGRIWAESAPGAGATFRFTLASEGSS